MCAMWTHVCIQAYVNLHAYMLDSQPTLTTLIADKNSHSAMSEKGVFGLALAPVQTEEDSIHQLDRAAQVTIPKPRTDPVIFR